MASFRLVAVVGCGWLDSECVAGSGTMSVAKNRLNIDLTRRILRFSGAAGFQSVLRTEFCSHRRLIQALKFSGSLGSSHTRSYLVTDWLENPS